jgi:hypothetical protein
LTAFSAPTHVVEAARNMQPTEVVYLGVPPVRIDILQQADGIDTEQTLGRAMTVNVGDLAVPVISLEDLIANESAAGRPQDIALLERVRGQP